MDDDPLMDSWPIEVREAWQRLRLPSLAEQLVAYERLAAEVRRQNHELRRLAAALQAAPGAVSTPADDGARLAAALESAQALAEGLVKAGSAALLEVCEAAERHATGLAGCVDALLARPAARGWFGRALPWNDAQRSALLAQVEGARLVAQKVLASVTDTGLKRLQPGVGEAFDPERHRCVGTGPGPAGRIVAVERAGWARGTTIIRPVEVIVGQEPSP